MCLSFTRKIGKFLIVCISLISLFNPLEAKEYKTNQLSMAVAWKQTSAEYQALYYQAYNIAHDRLQKRLSSFKKGDRPLAVLMDMDDTILSAVNYWGYLIKNNQDFF